MDWTGRPFIKESEPVERPSPATRVGFQPKNWASRFEVLGNGQTVTIWDLADAGGVSLNKATDGAAGWLWDCWDSGENLWEYDDIQDGVNEVADGAVPPYTSQGWLYFYELAAWDHDSIEYADDLGARDMTRAMQVVLYHIAEGIIQYRVTLMEEWADKNDDPFSARRRRPAGFATRQRERDPDELDAYQLQEEAKADERRERD